jgi:hypothetical protein
MRIVGAYGAEPQQAQADTHIRSLFHDNSFAGL